MVVAALAAAPAVGRTDGAAARSAGGVDWAFGAFAGYQWFGRVTELRAEWVVPRIESSPADGTASTWIGAEAPGKVKTAPFIQIGTQEQRNSPSYAAFWSDTRRGFHPQLLFDVAPGDTISASLRLAPGRRWELEIVDASSGERAAFATGDEAGAAFNDASWLQEDVTDSGTSGPFPYPQLTPTRFVRFSVNGVVPRPDSLGPRWMSLPGERFLGPHRLGDSFTVRRVRLTVADERFLVLDRAFSRVANRFVAELARWTAATPASQIRAQAAPFAGAARPFVRGLAAVRWPTRVTPLIGRLIGVVGRELLLAQPAGLPSAARIGAWRRAWYEEADAFAAAYVAIRSRLNAPPPKP